MRKETHISAIKLSPNHTQSSSNIHVQYVEIDRFYIVMYHTTCIYANPLIKCLSSDKANKLIIWEAGTQKNNSNTNCWHKAQKQKTSFQSKCIVRLLWAYLLKTLGLDI